jgi:hypothetical protein
LPSVEKEGPHQERIHAAVRFLRCWNVPPLARPFISHPEGVC